MHQLEELLIIFLPFLIGLILTFKTFISFTTWIFNTCLRSEKHFIKSYGSWALITGSTDGIGKALSYQLAERNLNLILVSRNSKKLETVKNEISTKNPHIQIKTVTIDFSGDFTDGVREIEILARDLDLGILINNVGISYPKAMFFHEVKEETWMKIVRVNIESTTRITKAVIGGMMERKKGSIVNIGSGAAAVVPSHPLFTIYAATKAYVDQFSRSLHVEYKQYGIHVQCQVPLYVATNMVSRVASIGKDSFFIPTPEGYAKAAIRKIGYEQRCTPYWAHSIQWAFACLIPNPLLDYWRMSIGLRRRRNHMD
ncbi:very-long-chain 3-oxoacyl-CoA reductase-like protein At1g24470 [Trifolium pratense]|nr:very-long-chain 3-oxoacyl-CoA reductase-like protein At1g24470 [Trifolium pratense]